MINDHIVLLKKYNKFFEDNKANITECIQYISTITDDYMQIIQDIILQITQKRNNEYNKSYVIHYRKFRCYYSLHNTYIKYFHYCSIMNGFSDDISIKNIYSDSFITYNNYYNINIIKSFHDVIQSIYNT